MINKRQIVLNSVAFLILVIIVISCQLLNQNYKFPDSYSYLLACKELYFNFKLNDHRPFYLV